MKVHHVKKSKKDYPNYGIKKGESYYWWKFKFGRIVKSKTYPKRSELTQSSFLANIYDIEDRISSITDFSMAESERDDIVSELEGLKDECQEKLDSMPEQLRESSSSGNLLQERVDNLDEMINNLNAVDFSPDIDKEEKETDDEYKERIEEEAQFILEEIQGISYEGG